MKFLLDTNVVSEARRGDRADSGVAAWFATTPGKDLYLSVVVLGEIRKGIESKRRRDAAAADALDRWYLAVVNGYHGRILPIDAAIADCWGRLNVPDPLPAVDGVLAATALVHGMTLVTRNTKDVVRTGATLHNPFTTTE